MRVALAATIAVLLCAGARPATAQVKAETSHADASPEERQAARALADKGLELFEAGKWVEALDRFQRAETVLHAPTHLLYMARAEARLGRLLPARKLYERVAAETLPAGAPKAFVQARAEAEAELSMLVEDIPTLQVVARHGNGRPVTVEIDGARVGEAPVALEPGMHLVAVRSADQATVTRNVELARGARERVEIVVAGTPPPPAPTPAPEAPSPANPLLVPAIVAFGVAGVGAALGVGFGAAASGEADDFETLCPNNPCSSLHRDVYDSAVGLATVSTVSFIVAGVAAAGGVTLWVAGARRAKDEPSAHAPSRAPFTTAFAAPLPGGATLGARGAF